MNATRDAERSRSQILDAAEHLFAEHGYRGASMRAIGERAGVSRGTPGYFFGSKRGLYQAVLERVFGEVGAAVRDEHERVRSREGSLEEILAGEIEVYMQFLVRRPSFVRLLEWESVTGGDVLPQVAAHLETITGTLGMISEELGRDGLSELDPVQLMVSIMALCWFPLAQADTLMKALGRDPYDPAFVRERTRHVVKLVLTGIGRPHTRLRKE